MKRMEHDLEVEEEKRQLKLAEEEKVRRNNRVIEMSNTDIVNIETHKSNMVEDNCSKINNLDKNKWGDLLGMILK